jgi:hypothetical protein
MKRVILLVVFILTTGYAFSEIQMEIDPGFSIRMDKYAESDKLRTIYALDFNYIFRYMPIKYAGVFAGLDLFTIAGADNSEYLKDFYAAGMSSSIDKDAGVGIGGRLGLSLSYPFNSRFNISSDIGMSFTYLLEAITVHAGYQGQTANEYISIDSQNIGITASLFGSFRFNRRLVLAFGAKSEFIISRKEKTDIAAVNNATNDYVSIRDNEFVKVNFSGTNITPFIGLCLTFMNNS